MATAVMAGNDCWKSSRPSKLSSYPHPLPQKMMAWTQFLEKWKKPTVLSRNARSKRNVTWIGWIELRERRSLSVTDQTAKKINQHCHVL